MSVIFSRSCEYATQAVLFLAQDKNNKPVLARDIAAALDVPQQYLSKVLQSLTHHGIIASHKGSTGGFSLGTPAGEITLARIVHAIDGDSALTSCVLGFPECDSSQPCPVHNTWGQARSLIVGMLNQKTIAEMAREVDMKFRKKGKKTK